jgi:pimeloyl-ACP methyl ester carboxylesterase
MKRKIGLIIFLVFCLTVISVILIPKRTWGSMPVSKDGVPISFSVTGKGEPTLLFVHGWSCNRSFWRKQVPYFEKKYRVVTLDLAGHGTSGKKRTVYSMEAFGEDVAAVVRAINAHKVILIGHSMAGAIIIETAEIIPDNIIALVGIDTMHDFEETYTPKQIEEDLKSFKKDFSKATDSFIRSMFVKKSDPNFVDEIVKVMSAASAKVGISAMEEMMKTSYIANPPNINVPVWCLNSDLWPTKPEVNRKYVPEFNLRIMPGVGHFLMLESPDKFNRQLGSIIREIVETK